MVEENAQLHGWEFERVGQRRFRVSLSAGNGDAFQIEVECDGFPAQPAAFHWRNCETGQLDDVADSPEPYGFFFSTGEICAPWNRLASRMEVRILSGSGRIGCNIQVPKAPSRWRQWCYEYTTNFVASITKDIGIDKKALVGNRTTVSSDSTVCPETNSRHDHSIP